MLLVLGFPVQSASQVPLHCLNVTILMVQEKTDNISCTCNIDCVFRGWHHIDISYIGDTLKVLTTSVFKAKILNFYQCTMHSVTCTDHSPINAIVFI